MTKPKVLVVTVPEMIGEDDFEPLRKIADVDYRELASISDTELASQCAGFDYLMLNFDVVKNLRPEFYDAPEIQGLKAISTDITGMKWASPQSANSRGVALFNTPHYSTESVAETVLAEVLLHSRQRHSAYQDEIHNRPVEGRKGINLLGKTAGVVGLGPIGNRVAELLTGIGMNVITWNRTARDSYESVELSDLFSQSAVICICVKTVNAGPDANLEFITDDLLALCRSAIIVNLADADLVDHRALSTRIQSGNVAAYTVERSPALLESPLASSDAVHLASNNSWISDESLDQLRKTWVENVIADIAGKPQNIYTD